MSTALSSDIAQGPCRASDEISRRVVHAIQDTERKVEYDVGREKHYLVQGPSAKLAVVCSYPAAGDSTDLTCISFRLDLRFKVLSDTREPREGVTQYPGSNLSAWPPGSITRDGRYCKRGALCGDPKDVQAEATHVHVKNCEGIVSLKLYSCNSRASDR